MSHQPRVVTQMFMVVLAAVRQPKQNKTKKLFFVVIEEN